MVLTTLSPFDPTFIEFRGRVLLRTQICISLLPLESFGDEFFLHFIFASPSHSFIVLDKVFFYIVFLTPMLFLSLRNIFLHSPSLVHTFFKLWDDISLKYFLPRTLSGQRKISIWSFSLPHPFFKLGEDIAL